MPERRKLGRRMHETGRIERRRRRIAAIGDTGAAQRLLPRAVAILEIAVRRIRRRRERLHPR
ncbi:MAG: hypothetical protein WDN31_06875 [Hyphomicrobium sp.]